MNAIQKVARQQITRLANKYPAVQEKKAIDRHVLNATYTEQKPIERIVYVEKQSKTIPTKHLLENFPEPSPSEYYGLIDTPEFAAMIDFLNSEESRKHFGKCRKLGIPAGLWARYYNYYNNSYTYRMSNFAWHITPFVIIGIIVGIVWLIIG